MSEENLCESLLLCGFWELNLGLQPCCQEPTKPSRHHTMYYLFFLFLLNMYLSGSWLVYIFMGPSVAFQCTHTLDNGHIWVTGISVTSDGDH